MRDEKCQQTYGKWSRAAAWAVEEACSASRRATWAGTRNWGALNMHITIANSGTTPPPPSYQPPPCSHFSSIWAHAPVRKAPICLSSERNYFRKRNLWLNKAKVPGVVWGQLNGFWVSNLPGIVKVLASICHPTRSPQSWSIPSDCHINKCQSL